MAINTEDIEEKIQGAKMEGAEYQTEDDRHLLAAWENQLKEIKASASFLEHPETKKLLELIIVEITRINGKLVNDRDITNDKRQALFETRDFCDKIKGFLERNPEKAMDELEADIDAHVWREEAPDEDPEA